MSAIQGIQGKYDESYFLYGENYFTAGQRSSVPFPGILALFTFSAY
ncbi:hypothetical protein K2P47_04150 [Patescibacteria group bacterium]|nr:hypothetical protein [Patescibacteria group bacterium]